MSTPHPNSPWSCFFDFFESSPPSSIIGSTNTKTEEKRPDDLMQQIDSLKQQINQLLRDKAELDSIRATIAVNFGEKGRSFHGISVDQNKSIERQVMEVLVQYDAIAEAHAKSKQAPVDPEPVFEIPKTVEEYQQASEVQTSFQNPDKTLLYQVQKQTTMIRKGEVLAIFTCKVQVRKENSP